MNRSDQNCKERFWGVFWVFFRDASFVVGIHHFFINYKGTLESGFLACVLRSYYVCEI